MDKSRFICPICHQTMEYDRRIYRCLSGHCFDVAKEGYVNLLPVNRRHSDMPGDDKAMVSARTQFLEGGWYAPLRKLLCEMTEAYMSEKAVLIDAGCGEGYYTEALSGVVHEKGGYTAGLDLSKAAVRRTAKRCPDAEIAVASVYHMPVADDSANILVDCFAPLAEGEFHRVLKPGGSFFYVVPGQRHLWEMKELLYDQPYENPYREENYTGFRKAEEIPLEFRFQLQKPEEIAALFHMTPYAWKTPKEGAERLLSCQTLTITAQFRILIYIAEDSTGKEHSSAMNCDLLKRHDSKKSR